MLPPVRLRKKDADRNTVQFIKPASEDAAMLRLPAVQVGTAYGATALPELQMYLPVRAAGHDRFRKWRNVDR